MPAANKHPLAVEPQTVATIHTSYWVEDLVLKSVSRLSAADGSLLFIVQVQYERHNAGDGTQGSKDRQNGRSNMYPPPSEKFPAKAAYTPPFRSRGTQATVFYRTPSAKATRTVRFHVIYYTKNRENVK